MYIYIILIIIEVYRVIDIYKIINILYSLLFNGQNQTSTKGNQGWQGC